MQSFIVSHKPSESSIIKIINQQTYIHVYTWMEKNGYSKEDIRSVKAAPDYEVSVTGAISCKLLLDGMPDFNQKEDDYWQTLAGTMGHVQLATIFIKQRIERAIEKGKNIKQEKDEKEKEEAKKIICIVLVFKNYYVLKHIQ